MTNVPTVSLGSELGSVLVLSYLNVQILHPEKCSNEKMNTHSNSQTRAMDFERSTDSVGASNHALLFWDLLTLFLPFPIPETDQFKQSNKKKT